MDPTETEIRILTKELEVFLDESCLFWNRTSHSCGCGDVLSIIPLQLVRNIDSPYVMKFLGCMLCPFAIVMPWKEHSLWDALRCDRMSADISTRLYWAYCCSMGILSLHTANVVHRDIKSLNFMLDQGPKNFPPHSTLYCTPDFSQHGSEAESAFLSS